MIVVPRGTHDVSSTMVRMVTETPLLRSLVPPGVADLIVATHLYGFSSPSPSPSSPQVTVTTYNVLAQPYERELTRCTTPRFLRWDQRVDLICSALQQTQSDVVLLNEVTSTMLHTILEQLSGLYTQAHYRNKHTDSDGSAILFRPDRFRLLRVAEARLSTQYAQIVVAAELEHRGTGTSLTVASLHLKSGYADMEPVRLQKFDSAMAFLQKRGLTAGPLVLAGDLNSDLHAAYARLVSHATETYKLFDAGTLQDPRLPTYQHWHPSVFDYILTRGLRVRSYHVPPTTVGTVLPNAVHGSDHLPVTATLEIPFVQNTIWD